MTLRFEHVSDTVSDLFNDEGHKVGCVVEEGGQTVLYTCHSLRLTVPGLLELIEAMQRRHAELEYGS